MKKRIYLLVSAVQVVAFSAACAEDDSVFGSTRASWWGTDHSARCGSEGGAPGSPDGGAPCGAGGSAPGDGGAPGNSDDCSVTECFDVQSNKDISFIAVSAESCSGALVTLELFDDDDNPVDIAPVPHGQGIPCAGVGIIVDPQAMKFDGLSDDHYTLCVTYDGIATGGDIVVTAKAGQMCWEQIVAGGCEPCAPGGDDDDDDDDGGGGCRDDD